METSISRRRLLKLLAAGLGGACLNKLGEGSNSRLLAKQLEDPTLSTSVAAGMSATYPGRVIHIHSDQATHWSGETDYWNCVDQAVVNDMVNQGVMALTDTATVAAAWRTLLPGYQPGQGIAIKVSFNNTYTCNNTVGAIDGIIEPVNAIVSGLQRIGVRTADIWVYDATRALPNHFVSGGLAGIRYFDGSWQGICRERAGFAGGSNSRIVFSPPSGVPMPQDEYITDVLVNAHYLINMPIMKRHGVGVSLGFKNHFGTIDNPGELHTYIDPSGSNYRSDYSPLVDIYKSSHIRDKTILTVGDGLFAAKFYTYGPAAWTTFGNKLPNSLFFSTDPVAIDCVMHDFVAAEMTDLTPHANDYLRAAGAAGLGAFERGDPWGSGYQQIDCLKVSTPLRPTASFLSISSSDSGATLTWEHNRANTSYEVWRGADPDFTPRPGDSPIASGLPPSPNCTMAGDTITCIDRDVVGGASSYYYLVRALNMTGAFEDSNYVGVFSFAMWSN